MKFCNINFNLHNKIELFKEEKEVKFIITANADIIQKANYDQVFFDILNKNFVTFDGQIPLIFARLFNPKIKFQKLSGSDMIYDFCKFAHQKKYNIFLLGGLESSNLLSQQKLSEDFLIEVNGCSPQFENYPFSAHTNKFIQDQLSQYKPKILLVGFGAPKQEFWINDNLQFLNEIGVKFVVGVGGTFEFTAGTIKRSPGFISKIGLEGFYRLIKQPNKMRLQRIVNSFIFFKFIFSKPAFLD